MLKKLEGIVVLETAYGDNSKIINVLTRDFGLVGIMAKGVKSIKNPLRTKTLKFTYGYFHVDYKENKLSKLIDVDIIDGFKYIMSDIVLISYANYMMELILQVAKQSDSSEIYDIFINAMLKMNEGLDPLVLTNILEIKMLEHLGVGLVIDGCIGCGRKDNIVTMDASRGGFVCQDCYHNEKIVSSKAIKIVRIYSLIDISKISKTEINEDVTNEIGEFLNDYYEKYTGLYLKSKDFLKKIRSC